MTETPPTFTLNDFPNEILGKLIPDYNPCTISSLKRVSKRFYDFFSYDYYYKFYLHFPEKHYLCEAKCEKSSGKEVFKDIERGAVGKWKGYLTIENIHLKNWSRGDITHSEIVPLPNLSPDFDGFNIDGVRWHELIDEDAEHWLLNLRDDASIVLLNITDKPKMFVEQEMYGVATECVRLLSGQVICISYNMQHIVVLNIVYDGDDISLQCNFDYAIDIVDFKWITVTGKCESDRSQRNMFVSVRELPRADGLLHFRDLKTGNVLEDIRLWDYKCLSGYSNVRSNELVFQFLENVEFPNIVMTILDNRSLTTMVLVFNVDTMQATTFIDMSVESVAKCYISYNVAYIFSSTYERNVDLVNVHRVSLERSCANMEKPTTTDRVFQFPCKGIFDGALSKHLKFAFKDSEVTNKVHVMSIKGFKVSDVQVFLDIDEEYKILSVIGPDVLIIQTLGKNRNIISFKIPKEGEGQAVKVIDWAKVFAENKTQFSYPCPMLDSMDFSKLVFYDKNSKDGECLAIYHF